MNLRKLLNKRFDLIEDSSDIPELAGCPAVMKTKLKKLFLRESEPRNRLALTQGFQLFSFILTLGFAASAEWFFSNPWLNRAVVVLVLIAWVAASGIAGNRARRLNKADFRAFVREYCPDGRPRFCVQCDYDLRGSTGVTCPECGESVPVVDLHDPRALVERL